jgi:TRAP-type C4-dicarboxylate transport system substrate-binding protein
MPAIARRQFGAGLLASGAMLAAPSILRGQGVIELKLSHFVPATHGMHTQFLEPWARDLEQRSDGALRIQVFPGTAALGNVTKQYDQVLAGVTDIGYGLPQIPRGRFPRTSVIEMPFLTPDAGVATRTLWALLPKYLAEEYSQVKVLALHAHNGGLIHTRGKLVRTMADLEGLRLRTPSPAVSSMLEYLGATPVGLPPGQVYESLQKGAIDGTVFPWDPVHSYKLAELLTHHLEARAYTVPFYFVMSMRSYEGLPDDLRTLIDEASGDALIPKFGAWWDGWDRPGREAALARGNTITELSPEERSAWIATLQPMIEGWLDGLEDDDVANAREIYAEAQRLVALYSET